jgi:hypothetical protein
MSSHNGFEEFQEDFGEPTSGDIDWDALIPDRISQ